MCEAYMAMVSSNGKASIDAIASENGWIKENETVCPSWQSRKICCLTSSKSICTSGFQPCNQPTPPKKNLPSKYGEKNLDLAPLEGDLLILRVMQNFGSSCDQ